MIKLVCKTCGVARFTANTLSNQKCDKCEGELEEDVQQIDSKDTE
jgi:hypothetical protein